MSSCSMSRPMTWTCHDRAFLNNVVTGTFAIEGGGKIKEYVGGYDDWVRQKADQPKPVKAPRRQPCEKQKPKAPSKPKLSYKEQKELEALPALIEKLEADIADAHTNMADPAFYKQSPEAIATVATSLEQMQQQLDTAYA
ncbi:MAG: hypothetical protein ACYTET_07565, partial [Planctomycetota bacterium]